MNTRKLYQFMVVAEEGSIRRAAEKLHITQPALTRVIRSLEEDVGRNLFIRKADGVLLTEAGAILLDHARKISLEIERARSNLLKAGETSNQILSIGFTEANVPFAIKQIIDEFSKNNKEVNIEVLFAPRAQHLELLRTEKLSISVGYYLEEHHDIACEEILSEPIWVAMHKDHPMAFQENIEIEKLRDEVFIRGANKPQADLFGKTFGLRKKGVHRAGDLVTAMMLVDQGCGLFFIPPSARFFPFKNIVYRPFDMSNDITIGLQCMYLKNQRNASLSSFISCVREFSNSHQKNPSKFKILYAKGEYGVSEKS